MSRLINLVDPQIFRHWTPRYFHDRLLLIIYEKMHSEYPWLTQQANTLLQSWLKKTYLGLEWGSGRSTIWFARRVANLTSVEHDSCWYNNVKTKLQELKITNTQLYLFEITPKCTENQSNPYVAISDSFPNNSLDFVLVDGKFRSECALGVLQKIKPGGLLIIDNINLFLPSNSCSPNSRTEQAGSSSEKWRLLADFIARWRCIWTSNGVSDTAIWIKPYFHTGEAASSINQNSPLQNALPKIF